MKRIFIKFMVVVMLFVMALPVVSFGSTVKSSITSETVIGEKTISDYQASTGAFEQVMSGLFISVGDYAHDFLSQSLKEELTIDKIVYNKSVMLNANFFNNSVNSSVSGASKIVRDFINGWFDFFRKLALVIIIICIVVAGIKLVVGTGQSRAGAYEILKKVVMAVVLVYFFPFVMKLGFDINEAIIQSVYNKTHVDDGALGVVISPVSDLMQEELEFRSPQYVSAKGLRVTAGSQEANMLYLNQLEEYVRSADVMRIMRAFAGLTLRFIYVIVWYIMLVQLYILVVIYLKRYVTIAFLITIYPVTIIGFITSSMFGQSKTAFNDWCKKFFSNVFLQTIHALTYGIISGVVIKQIQTSMTIDKINWLLMIIAVAFLFTGEKILAKIWNAAIDTSERSGMKSVLGAPKRLYNTIRGK